MIVNLILIVLSLSISIVGILYILTHRENYGSNVNVIFLISIFFFVGIIYCLTFNLAYINIINKEISLFFWKMSLIIGTFSLVLLSSIQSLILEENKIKILPTLLGSLLGGIIITLVLSPDSVDFVHIGDEHIFVINDPTLLLYIILLNIIFIMIGWYFHIKNYFKIRNKELAQKLTLMIALFTFTIFIYCIFILSQGAFLKYIHLFLFLAGSIYVLYSVVKKSDLFIALTNSIYNFVIFHRSGILLYSYNFETGREIDDSILKGTILIGISHILANFKEKQDKLNLIKMKNHDIILEYDIQHGYALLLIANKKTDIIEKLISRFMKKFTEINEEELKKINELSQLIDLSVFKKTRALILEFFKPYILKD